MVALTVWRLKADQKRSLAGCTPLALVLGNVHRGGEAFLVVLGVDAQKIALRFWQGSSENHEIFDELFKDLERRGLVLPRRIWFMNDGDGGLHKALREVFGKKLAHQLCAIQKILNLQRYLAKRYRNEVHQ